MRIANTRFILLICISNDNTMKQLILPLLFFLGFLSVPLSSKAFFNKDLHQLTMKEGMSDNTVPFIYKDKEGFMWFGTNNGISRYDGKTIKNFSYFRYMSVSEIHDLPESCLGIIANRTFYIFDRRKESFIPITGDNSASKILPADNGLIWGIRKNELLLYRLTYQKNKQGEITSANLNIEKKYNRLIDPGSSYISLCPTADRSGLYLLTNRSMLLLFDYKSKKIERSIRLGDNQNMEVHSMLSTDHYVWVGTSVHGLYGYSIQTNKVLHMNYEEDKVPGILSHTDVYQIVSINPHSFVAATWNGYTVINMDKENPDSYTTEVYNNVTLVNRNLETRMISAYYDTEGILWIGTHGGGVIYSDLRMQYYKQFQQDRHNEICGIEADNKGYIWLATFHKGIMRSESPFEVSHPLHFSTQNDPEIKSNKTVLSLFKDTDGNLWFGNRDGTLTFYNVKSGKFKVHTLFKNGEKPNNSPVWAICIDRNDNFWIGTEVGILLYDRQKSTCRPIELKDGKKKVTSGMIRAITQSRDGSLWVGTAYMGVCKLSYNRVNKTIKIKNGYEDKYRVEDRAVRSLLSSTDGYLYIGYESGFGVLNPEKDTIMQFYTTREGLCSNIIGCMVEDRSGHIWLGSNSGISRYSRHQHLFYNYYISGSNRSALLYGDMLLWGNNKSLTYFNPQDVDAYQINNKVLITGLEISDHPISIGENINGQVILQKNISFIDKVLLSNKNRDFSLTFNNLSYSSEQQKYNYRLLPYQQTWLISKETGRVSYTNLPEGEYKFEVRSIYPDGDTGMVTSLDIRILPHWSHTILFRLLIISLFIGSFLYWMYIERRRRKRVEHELQMKHELMNLNLEREKERQILTERENFFTSAAHELRTPLTLIISPLQDLLHHLRPDNEIYKPLLTMYKNGVALHSLVDQLLYVQKIEAGMVKLSLSEVDIVGLTKGITDAFCQIAEAKGFHFEINLSQVDNPYLLYIDTVKITSAIRNLLSNAFKYTPIGGKVSVTITRAVVDEKYFCMIKVADTGTGIPQDLQERVFESFITGDNQPSFSTKIGVGLRIVRNTMDLHHGRVILHSTPGEGSCFELHIPEGKAHFSGDSYHLLERNETETLLYKPDEFVIQNVENQSVHPPTMHKKKILVVEDNEDIRHYICSLFAAKYTLLEACNGQEGVDKAMEGHPDLIILDVMMPVMDGFSCCRKVKTHSETVHIPVLMLTAKAEDNDVLQSSKCGADDYMMKPFNPEVLKAKADNLILQREQLKRIYTKALMLKETPQSEETENTFIQKVIGVIKQNLSDEHFSVKSLAEQLNMSQPTLYRKMKQCTDMSVVDVIRSVRVAQAASLIMGNQYSIQEISEKVGFSDVRTLRKHFTEQFGVSPSKYAGDDFSDVLPPDK